MKFTGNSQNNDLLDRETTGYELNLTANPNNNWRLILSASQGKSVESNMLKRTTAIMPELLRLWRSARQTTVTSASRTVAQEIADFQLWYDSNTAIEGVGSLGDREWQVKFFNRYNFGDGFLKGAFVGGGWRYQSAPIIGANAVAGIFYQGESITELDLFVGYQTRAAWFGRNARLSFQLNGNDLLQRRDYLSVRRDPNGILSVMRTIDPANYKLQAKINF